MRLLTDAMAGVEVKAPPCCPDCLVVVQRGEETTFRYLTERLSGLRGVQVTLDRRQPTPGPVGVDRRRDSHYFNALGVLIVRR